MRWRLEPVQHDDSLQPCHFILQKPPCILHSSPGFSHQPECTGGGFQWRRRFVLNNLDAIKRVMQGAPVPRRSRSNSVFQYLPPKRIEREWILLIKTRQRIEARQVNSGTHGRLRSDLNGVHDRNHYRLDVQTSSLRHFPEFDKHRLATAIDA